MSHLDLRTLAIVRILDLIEACYFNSLIQAYFFMPNFVDKILTFTESKYLQQELQSSNAERAKMCHKLVYNLAELFSKMIMLNQKYTEPSKVLQILVDDFGRKIDFGEQKDIGEFNLNFLERLEEGLGERKKEENKKELSKIAKPAAKPNTNRLSALVDEEDEISTPRKDEQDDEEILEIDKNSIFDTFFGRTYEIIKVESQKKSRIINQKKEKMGPIMLDLNHKDLYEAWTATLQEVIDDFKYNSQSFIGASSLENQPPKCIKELWINDLPQTLFFTFNRVGYDQKKHILKKNYSKFTFEKTIFADRFLYKNKAKAKQIQIEINDHKKVQEMLEQQLEVYKNYFGVDRPAIETLDQVNTFLKEQLDQHDSDFVCIDSEDGIALPGQLGSLGLHESKLENAKEVLQTYREEIEKQMGLIQTKLDEIHIKMVQCYALMRETIYHLHAILIHDGKADSGHYYAFIYDRHSKSWLKFSDFTVSRVEEQEVFDISFGGKGEACAYGVIYVNQEIADKQQAVSIDQYSETFLSKIPSVFIGGIQQINTNFTYGVERYEVEKICTTIVQTFTQRKEHLNTFISNTKKNSYSGLQSLESYIFKQSGNSTLVKWLLLNNIVKETHPHGLNLPTLTNSDPIRIRLNQLIPNPSMTIQPAQMIEIKRYHSSFKLYLKKAEWLIYFLENLNPQNWRKAVCVFKYYKQELSQGHEELSRIPVDANKVFILWCCSMVNQSLVDHKGDLANEFVHHALVNGLQMLEPNDYHYVQMKRSLNRSYHLCQKVMTLEQERKYRQLLDKMNNNLITEEEELNPIVQIDIEQIFSKIDMQPIETWIQPWDPSSLASRFNSTFIDFKKTYKAWITLQMALLKNKGVLPDQEYDKFESAAGVDVKKLVNVLK